MLIQSEICDDCRKTLDIRSAVHVWKINAVMYCVHTIPEPKPEIPAA